MTFDLPTENIPRHEWSVLVIDLRATLHTKMRELDDLGPVEAFYPGPESFTASDRGQRAPLIAWTPTMVYTRVESYGRHEWTAVPRHPVLAFTQMLRMGYS